MLSLALACSLVLDGAMAWNMLPQTSLLQNKVTSRAYFLGPQRSFYNSADSRKSKVTALRMCSPVEEQTPTLATLDLPEARKGDCWRPTADDVDRISWGKPAKKKMTGSRGVPHRLNQDERMLYDMARRKGFLEMAGSGWRKQRRGAPLANTYRSWCDSQGVPGLTLHKDKDGRDEVVLDLSPMRIPEQFPSMAEQIAAAEAGATIESFEGMVILPEDAEDQDAAVDPGPSSDEEGMRLSEEATQEILAGFETDPIYRLPMFVLSWEVPRAEAKALAKRLAERFKTMEPTTKGKNPSKTLKRGMPQIKPGKSRRHGGYGIG